MGDVEDRFDVGMENEDFGYVGWGVMCGLCWIGVRGGGWGVRLVEDRDGVVGRGCWLGVMLCG